MKMESPLSLAGLEPVSSCHMESVFGKVNSLFALEALCILDMHVQEPNMNDSLGMTKAI